MSGERKALIVAVDQYEQEGLRDLLAPAADAEALAQVLGDAQIGGFTVDVVRNEPSHVIQAQIDDLFSESRPDDVLLLHFSCHGLKSDSGELFFAAANTRPNRLSSTAVSADFVQRCMRASRSRSIVLLLDCCYGGAFAQGVTVRAAGDVNVLDSFPKERGGGRGRAVITASTAMEYAFEGEQLTDDQHRRPSLFTNALTEGLATGDADRDEDGWVALNELYEYVFDKVREQNPYQTPSRQVEMEGDLYLARSRRRRIQAAPIPADLQAAMTDPNMYTRLGAVSELQARLTGDNLPAAAGAFEALEALRNDVRYIAVPAAAALAEAAVRPAPAEVRFGWIEEGFPPSHQQVRLLGPPIAQACSVRASHDWIRVHETAGGFDVSFDTSRSGRLRGSIEVKGPTGIAVVSVEVDRVAAADLRPASPAPSAPLAEPAPSAPSTEPVPSAPLAEAALVPEPEIAPVPAQTAPAPAPAPAPAEPAVAEPALAALPTATAESAIPTATAGAAMPVDRGAGMPVRPETAPPSQTPPSQPASSSQPVRPSPLHRWVHGPDRPVARAAGAMIMAVLLALHSIGFFTSGVLIWRIVFVIALLGLAVTALEMPPRWPTTFVHGLNAAFYVVFSLVIIHLYAVYFFPSGGLSPMLQRTVLAGTLAYTAAAIIVSARVGRGDRQRSSVLTLISLWLIVIGAIFLTVSTFDDSLDYGRAGSVGLLVAAAATLLAGIDLLSAGPRGVAGKEPGG